MSPRVHTYTDWRSLGPEKAAKYVADELHLNADRQRKLAQILRQQWGVKTPPPPIDTARKRRVVYG